MKDLEQNLKIIELANKLTKGCLPCPVKDKEAAIRNMQALLDKACPSVREAFRDEVSRYGWDSAEKKVYRNACLDENICSLVVSIKEGDDVKAVMKVIADDIYDMHMADNIGDPEKYMGSIKRTMNTNVSAYVDYMCRLNGCERILPYLKYFVPTRNLEGNEPMLIQRNRFGSDNGDPVLLEAVLALNKLDNPKICRDCGTVRTAKKCNASPNFVGLMNKMHAMNHGDGSFESVIANGIMPMSDEEIGKISEYLEDIYEKLGLYYKEGKRDEMFFKLMPALFNGRSCSPEMVKRFASRLAGRDGTLKTTAEELDMLADRNFEIYAIDFCMGSHYNAVLDRVYNDGAYMVGDVLIRYGLLENKKAFLKLISENVEKFESLTMNSILYMNGFTKIFNVNSLTEKNLAKLTKKRSEDGSLHILGAGNCSIDMLVKTGRMFTFEEIETVTKEDEPLQKLYVNLRIDSVDKRLLAFRQILHPRYRRTVNAMPEYLVLSLANAMSNMTFEQFCRTMPCCSSLKEEDKGTAVTLMAIYGIGNDFLCSTVRTAMDMTDARIIVGNYENPKFEQEGLEKFRAGYLDYDVDAKWLLEKLDYSPKELEQYHDSLLSFCMDGCHSITRRYYETVKEDEQKRNVILIASAAIQDKLDMVKYADFQQEIQYNISDETLDEWKENLSTDGGETSEYDDFLSCISIGERTGRTCMSYNGGAYNECCLATFDGNKKVIYAKKDGEYIGRAILRLTKYSRTDYGNDGLCFMDVSKKKEQKGGEQMILFLEKMYYANTGNPDNIRKHIVKLAKKKADAMGLDLVVADDYYDVVETTLRDGYIYVSKSKNGKQYMDSFGGSCHAGGFFKRGRYHFAA